MRHLRILPLLAALSLAPTCKDKDLEQVAKTLNIAAAAIGEFQTIVIEARRADLLSVEETRQLLTLSLGLNRAGKEAVQAAREIEKLSAQDRSDLLAVLNPMLRAVERTLATDALRIGNADTRAKILLALQSIRTSLNTAKLILAGGS